MQVMGPREPITKGRRGRPHAGALVSVGTDGAGRGGALAGGCVRGQGRGLGSGFVQEAERRRDGRSGFVSLDLARRRGYLPCTDGGEKVT